MLRYYPYTYKLQHLKHAQENVCHHGNSQYRIWLVEQELCIFPEHMTSPRVFGGVRIDQSFVFCVVFCRSLFDICLFLYFFPIVLSVLSQSAASDYHFGIFSESTKLVTQKIYTLYFTYQVDIQMEALSDKIYCCLSLRHHQPEHH